MLQVNDPVFDGKAVIVEISDNYRVFRLRSLFLGDPTTGTEFTVTFGAGETVDQIRGALGA